VKYADQENNPTQNLLDDTINLIDSGEKKRMGLSGAKA